MRAARESRSYCRGSRGRADCGFQALESVPTHTVLFFGAHCCVGRIASTLASAAASTAASIVPILSSRDSDERVDRLGLAAVLAGPLAWWHSRRRTGFRVLREGSGLRQP